MNTTVRQLPARRHEQDHRQPAVPSRRPLAANRPADPFWGAIAIRVATAQDRVAIHRLATLSSMPAPSGMALIGEVREEVVAVLAVEDGLIIADPSVASRDVVELLHLRADQLARADAAERGARAPRTDAAEPRPRALRARRPFASPSK